MELDVPMPVGESVLKGLVERAEGMVQKAIEGAIRTSLSILPGVKLTITDSRAKLKVDSVD